MLLSLAARSKKVAQLLLTPGDRKDRDLVDDEEWHVREDGEVCPADLREALVLHGSVLLPVAGTLIVCAEIIGLVRWKIDYRRQRAETVKSFWGIDMAHSRNC